MTYRICKTIEIESGHMLTKHHDNCKYPHGHSRQVELILEADELDANDMVCDFSVLKIALKGFLDSFDHAMCMNTKDPLYETFKKAYGDRVIGFDDTDPTTEVIARMIFAQAREGLEKYAREKGQPYFLANGVRLVRVRVWETSTSWAEFEQ
ncbi:MAG: 6-carboxytetrahydropterin synthase [Syntrophales bacterium]|jgi:6-pyruvoyltetrahydropterin/6-carboxytetrahydropterin synthase|nr:6-carboxytetrahydropterin synthase [Syntrophales bacterium]